MKTEVNEVTINGITYIKADGQKCATNKEGLKYVIVRTYSAGVFAGYIKSRNGMEVEMIDARRIYYWEGAASLSEMAFKGVSKPDKCKFPAPVSVTLTQAIEILDCTEQARKNIEGVKIWTVH